MTQLCIPHFSMTTFILIGGVTNCFHYNTKSWSTTNKRGGTINNPQSSAGIVQKAWQKKFIAKLPFSSLSREIYSSFFTKSLLLFVWDFFCVVIKWVFCLIRDIVWYRSAWLEKGELKKLARCLMECLRKCNIVLWHSNSLDRVFWQKGELEKAIDLLLEMNQKGIHMITIHYGLKVSAC